MSSNTTYLKMPKKLYEYYGGMADLSTMQWYCILLDYSNRFKPDANGYFRVSRCVMETDWKLDRHQIQYLNRKLSAMGLLTIDKTKRGKRVPTGYRLKQL